MARKYKFIEGKERLFVWIVIVASYIVLVGLSMLILSNIEDKIKLEMKFDSEKSFNSVYMSLNDSPLQIKQTMEREGVTGIGIYSSNGSVYERLGDAPEHLNFRKLVSSDKNENDSTMGIYYYDSEKNTIEYFRLSRFGVLMGTGTMSFTDDGVLFPVAADIPEIVYVKFNGSDFFNSILKARIVFFISVVFITLLISLIGNAYESNRKFRMAFEKNESLAKLGAAARTLTHEIKNPLSVLTIQSALLKKTLPQQYSGDLEIMDQEIQRLTLLTNKVSEFLKNPMGHPEKINLIPYLKTIIQLFPFDILYKYEEGKDIFIKFDLDRARSVFENIIKNATESCEGRDPEIEVEVFRKHRNVNIVVKDRGDGLTEDAHEKLFSAFYTTKIHGSGIGLSISRQFVRAQGGSLKLFNRDGGGTVAQIVLPCYEEEK